MSSPFLAVPFPQGWDLFYSSGILPTKKEEQDQCLSNIVYRSNPHVYITCTPSVTANNHATFTIQMYVNYSTELRLLLGHQVTRIKKRERLSTIFIQLFPGFPEPRQFLNQRKLKSKLKHLRPSGIVNSRILHPKLSVVIFKVILVPRGINKDIKFT